MLVFFVETDVERDDGRIPAKEMDEAIVDQARQQFPFFDPVRNGAKVLLPITKQFKFL